MLAESANEALHIHQHQHGCEEHQLGVPERFKKNAKDANMIAYASWNTTPDVYDCLWVMIQQSLQLLHKQQEEYLNTRSCSSPTSEDPPLPPTLLPAWA